VEDHAATLLLLHKYRFPHTHISQFYPRWAPDDCLLLLLVLMMRGPQQERSSPRMPHAGEATLQALPGAAGSAIPTIPRRRAGPAPPPHA
jgi:hypothetical protein